MPESETNETETPDVLGSKKISLSLKESVTIIGFLITVGFMAGSFNTIKKDVETIKESSVKMEKDITTMQLTLKGMQVELKSLNDSGINDKFLNIIDRLGKIEGALLE